MDKGRQVKPIRFGPRLLRHAQRLVFQPAEVAVPPTPFQGLQGLQAYSDDDEVCWNRIGGAEHVPEGWEDGG